MLFAQALELHTSNQKNNIMQVMESVWGVKNERKERKESQQNFHGNPDLRGGWEPQAPVKFCPEG